jgi:hypothetical protein
MITMADAQAATRYTTTCRQSFQTTDRMPPTSV